MAVDTKTEKEVISILKSIVKKSETHRECLKTIMGDAKYDDLLDNIFPGSGSETLGEYIQSHASDHVNHVFTFNIDGLDVTIKSKADYDKYYVSSYLSSKVVILDEISTTVKNGSALAIHVLYLDDASQSNN